MSVNHYALSRTIEVKREDYMTELGYGVNKLILGDNGEVLKTLESESVDLIYLDPPFFSNRTYEGTRGDAGEVRRFQDRWAGGIDHYIAWLKERVEQMHRILKPTGSIFLHCDWHANAYIRVDILDRIFGCHNFRNEIVWCYTGPGSPGVRQFLKKHDTIFWYSKGSTWTFNGDEVRFPHSKKTKENYKTGLGGSGFEGASRKINEKGKVPEDWWIDITIAARYPKQSENNVGYPTQKPIKLLERIIKASSNEGDIVLDPFMGGGTAIAVADRLKRRWIGIDQSAQAVEVTELRLQKQPCLFAAPYTVQLHKYDYDMLRYKDAFQFESWIVQQFGGTPNAKQRGDRGLDGKAADGAPVQVNRSDNIGRDVIDNFIAAVQRFDKNLLGKKGKNEKNSAEKKPLGYIIAFSFNRGAIEEVVRLKNENDHSIQLVRVEDIVPIATKPVVGVHINELERNANGDRSIEFSAVGESPAGIEFYGWDFAYNAAEGFKPSIIIDKEGRQIAALKAGTHTIAVKVVDNDGLENIEIIKLSINGAVEQSKEVIDKVR
jgi:DNA modification methylase